MRIPKVIHYCWFGRGPKSGLILKCIDSWKRFCPDYEIVEWNEDNFDINFCPYAAKAYREKRYAFLSDAARLKIVYENGGVYLDTDVELKKSLDALMDRDAWFGYGTATQINTGSGFGAVRHHPFLEILYRNYADFGPGEPYKLCTVCDTAVFSATFERFAADHDVSQSFVYGDKNVVIINDIWRYIIHHYTSTWQTPAQKVYTRLKQLLNALMKTKRV